MYSSIDELKKLAGVNEFKGYTEYQIDENPSITATKLKAKEKNQRAMFLKKHILKPS